MRPRPSHMLPLDARDVLICLRYGIGDVVMELPVLEALRRTLPEARITALGSIPAAQLLDDLSNADEVVGVERWGFGHRWDSGTEEERAALGAWVGRRAFDLVLDARLAPIGVGWAIWGAGFESLEADADVESHVASLGMGGVRAIGAAVEAGWGMPVPGDRPRLTVNPAERRFSATFLRERGIDEYAPIGISPVASLSLKRWPVGRLAETLRRLAEQEPGAFLIFCGPGEEGRGEMLARAAPAGRGVRVPSLHLRRTAALIHHCRTFIGNDTGLMHIAAAVGTPTIGIFGPSAPAIYRPPANAVAVGGKNVQCRHRHTHSLHPPACWLEDRCLIADDGCIHGVRVDDVMEALHQIAEHGR